MDTFKNNIINWWNYNGFLGFKIDNPLDIISILESYNKECKTKYVKGFDNIQQMINYHHSQNPEGKYFEEIKNYNLVDPKTIDILLLIFLVKELNKIKK